MGSAVLFKENASEDNFGRESEPDNETRALFTELRCLEGSIGKTGKLALLPFLRTSGKELWQLYMIAK